MSGPIVLALRLLMALALYGFLGWAIFVLARDVQTQGVALANRRVPGIGLTIHWNDSSSTKHFARPEIVVGRDPGCDISMNDDTLSTRHAQFAFHHSQWWISDLSSTNGTFLNADLITMPTVLASGDDVKCGNVRLAVSFPSDTFSAPTERLERPHG